MAIKTIRIIKASSPDREGLLAQRITELEAEGFNILFDEPSPDPNWRYTASSFGDRAKALTSALLEDASDAIMWARGGYGASDLLPLVPWQQVAKARPKPIIGFSDASAAQSALYTMTGRASLQGPMPATVTWRRDGTEDVEGLVRIMKGQQQTIVLPLTTYAPIEKRGLIFGGCLSVLTGLIGTPWLPKSFRNGFLFFEDVGENPGRVIRMLNQWHQANLFQGVHALVFGVFSDMSKRQEEDAAMIAREVKARFGIHAFTSVAFGHISPNMPIGIGCKAHLKDGELTWQWPDERKETV